MEILNYISPNDTIGKTDSESIQNAVDLAAEKGINKVIIPKINARTGEAEWVIEKTVRLPSEMSVVLDSCYMVMADDVVGGFFCSDNLFTERGTKLEERMYGISIRGEGTAILDGGNPTALNEATQKELGVPVCLNTPIFFMNVEGFKVENISIINQRYWGMRFQFCSKGIIRDIFFSVNQDRRNQDGINLRNGCHDILIENIHGQTGDDMIALSAIDTDKKAGFNVKYPLIVEGHDWDIHDVTIRNISGAAVRHPLVALRNHNGAKMYNITIENISDTEFIRDATSMYFERYALVCVGNNSYAGIRHSEIGETYNLSIRNIHAQYSARAVYVQSTIRDSLISGVYASGDCKSVIATTPDGWASAKSGVKLENVTIENVFFRPNDKENSKLIDFSVMREGDYVKNLYLTNINMSGVGAFAVLDDKYKNIHVKRGLINTDSEESLEIKYQKHYDDVPYEANEKGVWEADGRVVYDCRRNK